MFSRSLPSARPDQYHNAGTTSEAWHNNQVMLELPFEEWARAAFASRKYHEAQLTAEIVYAAQRLYSIPERGDRPIAATAIVLELPLITRAPEVQRATGVECIWS
jgi:hypothetical protein